MYVSQRIRALSILMAALLTFSLFPTTALSAGPEDSVIYNLGSRNVTVDYDSSAEETANHKIFNDDGSYTIQLEDNAF
ncbi:MAG: hypothetical protein LBT59_15195, partial [Clostridiales bacterium]|nr:hypothetical protein [Clostridiales bacterium]